MNFLRTEFELQTAFTVFRGPLQRVRVMYGWGRGVVSCMAARAQWGVLSGAARSVDVGIVARIAIVYRRVAIVYRRIAIVYRRIIIVAQTSSRSATSRATVWQGQQTWNPS